MAKLSKLGLVFQEVDPKSLIPHDLNPRSHSKRQKEAYRAFRQGLSQKWLGIALFNKTTGRLLNGHMRVQEAIDAGEPLVPCQFISVSEEEERYILEHLDSTGYLAGLDSDALRSLHKSNKEYMESLDKSQKRTLEKLSASFRALASKKGNPCPPVPVKNESETKDPQQPDTYTPPEDDAQVEEYVINNSVKFPATNKWHIPDLQPITYPFDLKDFHVDPPFIRDDTPISPFTYFCQSTRPFRERGDSGGILGFYTEDWRFEQCYSKGDIFAELLIEENWTAVITPDYSTYTSWPLPCQLFNVYRSRWCAALWQSLGVPIIPTIQYMGPLTNEICIRTLPAQCPILSMQCRKFKKGLSSLIKTVHEAIEFTNVKHFILYGGDLHKKKLFGEFSCHKHVTIHYLPQFITQRRKKLDGKAT